MKTRKKKYIFLYLKTGGGHLAPAKSIANYLNKYHGNEVETVLADGFENTNKLTRFIVEDGYRILQNKGKWIYEWLYAYHKIKIVSQIGAFLVSRNVEKPLTELIRRKKPDKIIVLHFFLIKPVYNIIEKLNLDIPVVTIVTDPYIAHPLWFLNKQQNFILFSEELKKRCLRKGIKEDRIKVMPFTLDEKYSRLPSAEEIKMYKAEHGFKKDKVLLVMGGGDGIPHGEIILQKLLKLNDEFEIAFVCGKNKKLYEYAMNLKEREKIQNLKIFGYIDFVYELLSISDLVITKCGASTFMEILLMNKVPLVNSYIWEQEKGNVDFLVNNQLGIYEKKIPKLVETVGEMFSGRGRLLQYKSNIADYNFENGTAKVSEFLLK